MDIKNLAVVITGGGSGMGAETARHMAKAGAKVALLDVNLDNAKKVAKEMAVLPWLVTSPTKHRRLPHLMPPKRRMA